MLEIERRGAASVCCHWPLGRLICTHTHTNKGLDFHLQGLPAFFLSLFFFRGEGGGGVCKATSRDFPVLVIVARSTELSMKVKTVMWAITACRLPGIIA